MRAPSRDNRVALALAALTADPDIPTTVKDRVRIHLEDVATDAGTWPAPDVETTISGAQDTLDDAQPPAVNPFAGLFAT